MKKLLGCLLLAIILSNCEISVKKTNAQDNNGPFFLMNADGGGLVNYIYKDWKGMKYVVISSYNGGTVTINLTKDELEVELLKKQLEKINLENSKK